MKTLQLFWKHWQLLYLIVSLFYLYEIYGNILHVLLTYFKLIVRVKKSFDNFRIELDIFNFTYSYILMKIKLLLRRWIVLERYKEVFTSLVNILILTSGSSTLWHVSISLGNSWFLFRPKFLSVWRLYVK